MEGVLEVLGEVGMGGGGVRVGTGGGGVRVRVKLGGVG